MLPTLLLLPACTLPWAPQTVHFEETADTAASVDTEDTELEGCDEWKEDWAEKEEEVLQVVNAYRSEGYHCYDGYYPPTGPLTMDNALRCAARLHSQDMGDNNWFSHTGSDGSSLTSRVEAQGYVAWTSLGENIAAGVATGRDAVELWLASTEGHCSNIMSSGYAEIGVGAYYSDRSSYGWYWTQDFGSR